MINKKNQRKDNISTQGKSFDLKYNTNFHYFLLFVCCLLLYGWTFTFNYNLDDDYVLTYLFKIENKI